MLKNILGYKDKESVGDKLTGGTKDKQSEQYRSINKNLMSVNRNLIAIAELITKGAQQEKKDDEREIKSKRREADAAKKGDKENFIESALKKSLIKPIEAAKKKVGGPFDRLKAMKALFMTLLGIKGLDALKAWQEGDNVKLEEIKNNVIKGLAIAGGIALALNGGIARYWCYQGSHWCFTCRCSKTDWNHGNTASIESTTVTWWCRFGSCSRFSSSRV